MKYFSSKVATGNVFCNRDNERAALIHNFKQNEHTVVVAPRRYGKTSLVIRAIEEVNQPYAIIDLFCTVYEDEIIRKIAKGVSQAAQQLMSRTDKAINFLESAFKSSTIGFKAGKFEIYVEFSRNTTVTDHIEDLLQGLEKIAKKSDKRVIFFMDEFQDLLKLEQSNQVQAAIRSVAQHSEYVSYVFSGSSRLMLEKIFEDKSQPLYMMCHKLLLKRIKQEDLKQHIQTASKNIWKTELPEQLLEQILSLTECHTYYTNTLCDELFKMNKTPISEDIELTWQQQLNEHQGKIIAELEKLSTNRLKVLTTLALMGEANKPNSQEFIKQTGLTLSSTQVAVKYLLDYDYIYQTESGSLRLVDPLMRLFIHKHHEY